MKLFQKLINLLKQLLLMQVKSVSLGKEINLTAGNTTIKSTNFSVDKNGNMSCSNANINGTVTSSNATITGGKIELVSLADSDLINTAFIIKTNSSSYWTRVKPHWLAMGGGSSNGSINLYNSNDIKEIELNMGEGSSLTYISHEINNGRAISTWQIGDDNTTKNKTTVTPTNIDTPAMQCSRLDVESNSSATRINPNGITTPSLSADWGSIVDFHQGSLEALKKNISKTNISAIDVIKNADIYSYNLKTEKDTDKKHIGFVIGKKYKTPNEVIAKSGDGIDTYTMTSLAWKAIQELIEENENLKQRITKLEAK